MSEIKTNRRTDILHAACREFGEKGFDQAKMEGIAKRAGIGKSTVYEYFSSKTELLGAVGSWVFDTVMRDLDEMFGREDSLRQTIMAYLQYMARLILHVGQGIQTLGSNRELFQLMQGRGRELENYVTASFAAAARRAQANGELSDRLDVQDIAPLVMSLHSPGVILSAQENWDGMMQKMVVILFDGLSPRENMGKTE